MTNIIRSRLCKIVTYALLVSSCITAASFDCPIGHQNFTVKLSENEYAKFSEARLSSSMDQDSISIYQYQSTDSLQIISKEVNIFFTGNFKIVDRNDVEIKLPENFIEIFHDRLTGTAVKRRLDSTIWIIQECRVILLPKITDSSKVHVAIAREIHRRAELCVQTRFCSRIQSMKFNGDSARGYASSRKIHLQTDENEANFKSIEIKMNDSSTDTNNRNTVSDLDTQKVINTIVDLGIHHLSNEWKTENRGMVNVSVMSYCVTSWGPCWEFKNGTIGNYTTLVRTSDAVLTRKKQKFTAESEFNLGMLHLNYDVVEAQSYLLKHAFRSLTTFVPNVKFRLRILGNYNKFPCTLKLDDLTITIPENIIIQVDGALDMFESTMNALAAASHDFLSTKIKFWAKNYTEEALSELDCESLRL